MHTCAHICEHEIATTVYYDGRYVLVRSVVDAVRKGVRRKQSNANTKDVEERTLGSFTSRRAEVSPTKAMEDKSNVRNDIVPVYVQRFG